LPLSFQFLPRASAKILRPFRLHLEAEFLGRYCSNFSALFTFSSFPPAWNASSILLAGNRKVKMVPHLVAKIKYSRNEI
jgi:hypothetical protein